MKIAGLSARTSNLDPEMGQIISSLWNGFFAQGGPQAVPGCMGKQVYGLYSDYESDFRSRYDITRSGAGCKARTAAAADDRENRTRGEIRRVCGAKRRYGGRSKGLERNLGYGAWPGVYG